ncbi:MAG TPA: ABC transporter permease subunit [Anaerolineales bacterium]|nr:ABC transporter permease subunit [Anaerolineales bacterium]
MFTIFWYSLGRSRGQILGWGLALAVLGGYLVGFYDTLAAQQETLEQLLASYPPELMAFFGDMTEMFTPQGYLHVEFFSYMPLILGIYAVLAGSGLLAGDEESGTLDLLMSHPLSRTALYLGRLAAFEVTTFLILLVTWAGFALVVPGTTMEVSPLEIAAPFLSLFIFLTLFGMLALFLSMVLPSRRFAAMTGGMLLVASFFISSLARIDENLEAAARYSPFNYYQGGEAIGGLEWGWIAGLLGFAVLFALLAWWRFERRDIRVGGEGGWGVSLPAFLKRRPAWPGRS